MGGPDDSAGVMAGDPTAALLQQMHVVGTAPLPPKFRQLSDPVGVMAGDPQAWHQPATGSYSVVKIGGGGTAP